MLIVLLTLWLSAHVTGQSPSLPAFFPLAAGLTPVDITDEAYSEWDFPGPDHATQIRRGRRWQGSLTLAGVPEDLAGKAIWARLKPSFLAAGWTVYAEFDETPYGVVLRLQKGRQAWAAMTMLDPGDIRLNVVEERASTLSLTLARPGKTPETMAVSEGDFPYLAPLPGSSFQAGSTEPTGMEIHLPGSDETHVVGLTTISRTYTTPATISNLEFATAYRAALEAAGWAVTEVAQGMHQSDALITAHYTKDGRDIWTQVHYGPGQLDVAVADAGARSLTDALAKDCRVVLTGVMFDFDKATLRPESESVLARAVTAVNATTKPIEVQGHTDNVGADAYNQTLSEARAKAVADWLVGHGVKGAQLTSKGYGKSKPVADNASDAGRARNRRVELACR